MKVSMLLSPESRLSDIDALLDTYGVEIRKDGDVVFLSPLWRCSMYEGAPEINGEINWSLKISLVPLAPRPIPSGREPRWPFFVESPLTVVLACGNQWVQYNFSSGKHYIDRTPPERPTAF